MANQRYDLLSQFRSSDPNLSGGSSSGGGIRLIDYESDQKEPSNQEQVNAITKREREKERRKRMKSSLASLQAKLPHLPAKSDHATILEAAEGYITRLENQVKNLQILNQGRSNAPNLLCSSTIYNTHNLSIDVSGGDARFCLIVPKRSILLESVISVLDKYKIQIKSTQVSEGDITSTITIHAHEAREGLWEYFPVNSYYTAAAKELQNLINPE